MKVESGASEKTTYELRQSLPTPEKGMMWPSLYALKRLSVDELKNFKLDKFEFWDRSKSSDDSKHNIAFRLYDLGRHKSRVICSRYWLNNPEGYN